MYKYVGMSPLVCTDVKVKIVTIPEDQLREAVEGEGEDTVSERTSENSDSDLSAAMSILLDSLLVSTAHILYTLPNNSDVCYYIFTGI